MCEMIVQVSMFSQQNINVYISGERIYRGSCALQDLFVVLDRLIDNYQINKISFAGPNLFVKGIITKFQKTTYFAQHKNLIIKEIKS